MNKKTIIGVLVIAVLAMLGVWLANSQGVRDYLLAMGYEPSGEVYKAKSLPRESRVFSESILGTIKTEFHHQHQNG